MKKIILFVISLLYINSYAQKKQLWAKSFINKKAPELVVEKWLSNVPTTKDKFILIDFWATWCGPCVRGIPEMNNFQKEFSEDLVVIGISKESRSKVKRFKKAKIEYFSAIDTKGTTSDKLKIKGIPHCIIINPKGIVVWEGWPQLKGYELTSEVIQKLISDYKS
ncbi:TlpA disulfide reductase family protein [uncultured Polaribacter sp.]|uniref:TlpA family protein disulfide reductase n=1 Tax=uncultured Polaribacter sp. TaxID=174711 RepID=UPI0026070FCF|nr:TlpA disulfide reductase family protein [uncultured Polaribacter sp.]